MNDSIVRKKFITSHGLGERAFSRSWPTKNIGLELGSLIPWIAMPTKGTGTKQSRSIPISRKNS
jgi:hypothetical protein